MKDKAFRINIKIDGKAYPLEINREDEERYRLAAKLVNETIAKFRDLFRDSESQDILAMSAFQIALEKTEILHRNDTSLFVEELKDLNDDIADFLKEKQ